MNLPFFYACFGILIFLIGLIGLTLQPHILKKLISLNIMGSGIFLVFVALAKRAGLSADPIPHAMVLTGLVVSVSATALGIILAIRVKQLYGKAELPEDGR